MFAQITIPLSIFTSVEFYVTAVMLSAFIVAFMARPDGRGAARTELLTGEPAESDHPSENGIRLSVDEDFTVTITRTCPGEINGTGATTLEVTVAGRDITAAERGAPPGTGEPSASSSVRWRIEGLAPYELYHFKYSSMDTELFAATPLRVKPGIEISRQLR